MALGLTVDLLIVSFLVLTEGAEQGVQSDQPAKKFAVRAGPFLGRRPVAALCYRCEARAEDSDEVLSDNSSGMGDHVIADIYPVTPGFLSCVPVSYTHLTLPTSDLV